MTIDELYKLIEDRKKYLQKDSYISSLFSEGEDRMFQKIGEEAIEVVIAAKNKEKERIISEVADLLFHSLVLLSKFEIRPVEILEELEKRKKVSQK